MKVVTNRTQILMMGWVFYTTHFFNVQRTRKAQIG